MESEAVKIDNFRKYFKPQAKILQLIKMEASPYLSEKLLLSFGRGGKGDQNLKDEQQ